MNKELELIINEIKNNDKIAIFNHNNIDGDSFSCSYGLLLAIKKTFPEKEVVWVLDQEEMKKNFTWLKVNQAYCVDDIDSSYLAIIGDTSSMNKVSQYDKLIKANKIICFDHHQNDINIKHDIFWKNSDLPASTIQAIEIAKELNVDFDEEIAFNLMIGLLTDTGNFQYSLGNHIPVQYFAEMLKFISNDTMDNFWRNMRKRTVRDIEVEKFFYENIKFEGKVAYVVFNEEDTAKFADINFKLKIYSIGNIENYPIWAIFVKETHNNHVDLKLHFRSNGPNVSKIAIDLGGGGHIRAAGAKIKYSENVIEKILENLNKLA